MSKNYHQHQHSKQRFILRYLVFPERCILVPTVSVSFLYFKTSNSGNENVPDMIHTAHAYVADVNILVLMLVLMPVLIPQV